MSRTLKLVATLVAAACALFVAAGARAQQQPTPQPQPAAASPRALTEQERRGKQIYMRGESPSGREIVAVVGEIDVPASTLTCAGCHGARGEGKTEGGVTAGNLTWANLVKPYGHTHPSGRKHGPFDESSFVRAVAGGIDPDGNELLVAMPRYRFAAEDLADLVAYLKRIEADRDPGLTETSIRVGTLLPAQASLAEIGAAQRDVLAAYFAEVNARGGVFNRKIELRAAQAGPEPLAAAAQARQLIEREQVFALVGGITAGAERELAALAAEHELPFIGPSTLLPPTGTPINRQVFYLMPGVSEQARALANFAASRPDAKKGGVAVVAPEGELQQAAAAAFEDQARRAGLAAPTRHALKRETFDAARLVRELKEAGAGTVFFLGGAEATAFVREAAAAGYAPHVLLLGMLTAADLPAAVAPSLKDRVFVAFPSVPSDITNAGVAEWGALREKHKLSQRHVASQLASLAAAKVFVEGLKRAGQDLSRERLLLALEGLYDFETAVSPRLTFGPNRRLGADGAHILTVDPEKKEYAPAAGWVKAN
jgi:ABC-type branched-subunit amino acid transport system substrate-binding protein